MEIFSKMLIRKTLTIITLLLVGIVFHNCSTIKNENISFDWGYYINKANTNESKVPHYNLPDPLIKQNGEKVENRLTWLKKRRPEILKLYENEIYGVVPEWNGKIEFITTKEFLNSLDGKASLKEVTVSFINGVNTVEMNMLIYTPNKEKKKHPLFVGLNFFGNHTVYPDSNITIADGYVINKEAINVKNHKSTEAKRGVMKDRWQVEKLIDKGYGLATIFYGDLDPDYDDGFQNGIHPLFYKEEQSKPKEDEWGSISAWAWGLSRAMDYFETDSQIDENKIAVIGHSRLGKTALWAGAQDKRFAITISNNSGSGGAALFRRKFGETINVSIEYAPQWYCGNFKKYNENEETLPIDQHMLISLIAPRPVYIASAEEDIWADPKGEFLSAKHAVPVYHLFNKKGIESEDIPTVNNPVRNSIGYHIRSGKHDLTEYDWNNYINFADKHFANKKKVALTFDDGPDSLFTEQILDVLKENNVKATFFLVGKNMEKYPNVVKRISKEGHLIGNHSCSHPHLNKIICTDSLSNELVSVDSLLENIYGIRTKYFRPPYGHLRDDQKEYLENKGYEVTMWDIDPKDWDIEHTTKNDIINSIKEDIFDGANILLHSTNASPTRSVRYRNYKRTVEALPEIITFLKSKDYKFVTIEAIQ